MKNISFRLNFTNVHQLKTESQFSVTDSLVVAPVLNFSVPCIWECSSAVHNKRSLQVVYTTADFERWFLSSSWVLTPFAHTTQSLLVSGNPNRWKRTLSLSLSVSDRGWEEGHPMLMRRECPAINYLALFMRLVMNFCLEFGLVFLTVMNESRIPTSK